MSATTPDAIDDALLALLQAMIPATLVSASDEWQPVSDVSMEQMPAAFLASPSAREGYLQRFGLPPLRTFTRWVIVYLPQPDKVAPRKAINALHQAFNLALAPDPVTGVFDLGGLVSHLRITSVEAAEGRATSRTPEVWFTLSGRYKDDAAVVAGGFLFNTGTLTLTPTLPRPYGGAADPTPARIASLREVRVEFADQLDYPGMQLAWRVRPMLTGRTGKMTARWARFDARALGQALGQAGSSAGATLVAPDVRGTVPGGLTLTPAVPDAGAWADDLGVVLAGTGAALDRVTAGPAAGQYSVAAGVYTFNAAQVGKAVSIGFLYTTAGGKVQALANEFTGLVPTFRAALSGEYNGRKAALVLDRVVPTSLALPTALEDFTAADATFEVVAAEDGTVGTLSLI